MSCFHDMSDPYSHLTTQVLHGFQDRYRINLKPYLISAPLDWVPPARAELPVISRKDAALLADKTGLFFRNPDSCLAFKRIRGLAQRPDAEFRIRSALPMVMRGLPVPKAKRRYILMAAAREAHRLGIPFDRLCALLGLAIEGDHALLDLARNSGGFRDYTASILRRGWSEGVDARADRGLASIVTRARLD